MYPEKCKWLPYDENLLYPLLQAYPETESELLLTFHVNLPKRIPICSSCKNPTSRYTFPFLHPIPDEIQAVPLEIECIYPLYLYIIL